MLACHSTDVSAEGVNRSNVVQDTIEVLTKHLLFQNNSKLLRVTCAIASLLFVISDTMIAIDKYYAPINNSTVNLVYASHRTLFSMNTSFSALDNDHLLCGPIRNHVEHCWFAWNESKWIVVETIDGGGEERMKIIFPNEFHFNFNWCCINYFCDVGRLWIKTILFCWLRMTKCHKILWDG